MAEVNLQGLYNDIVVKKDERKMIKASIKDHYDNSPEWKVIKEQLDEIKEKKKVYDQSVRGAYAKDFERIMELGDEIKADEELLSDLCFQELMKNNKVEIKDEKGNDYEPVIKVVFKRM